MLLDIKKETTNIKSLEYKIEYFTNMIKTESDRLYVIEGAIKSGDKTFNLDLLKTITTLLFFFIQRCNDLNDEHIFYFRKFQKRSNKIEPSDDLKKIIHSLKMNNFIKKNIINWE